MLKKATTTQLKKSFFEISEILSIKSNYTKDNIFYRKKMSYRDVIHLLLSSSILESYNITPTSNDILPMYTLSTVFKNGASGHSASIVEKDFNIVVSKAIGEGLERYFLTKPECSENKITKIETKHLTHLKNFPDYLPQQRNEFPFLWDNTKNFLLETVMTKSLFSNKKIAMPAQYIFWKHKAGGEPQLTSQTTNGGAGHFSKDAAIIAGIHEEIQRDTFLKYWLLKKEARSLDLASIENQESKKILNALTEKGIDVRIVVMENEYLMPIFTTILIDKRVQPSFVSLASGNDITSHENAILSSLYEAVSCLTFNETYSGDRFSLTKTYKPFLDNSINRLQRITMWTGPVLENSFNFLISKETYPVKYFNGEIYEKDPKKILLYIKNNLKKYVDDIYVYTVSSPILKKVGYHVVKVIIPNFLQLHLLEITATLRSERLAKELNKKKNELRLTDFNPLPHPFP